MAAHRQQAIEQGFGPHHTFAQLAQPEHHTDRNAVLLQVRVHRVGGLAAVVQQAAQLGRTGLGRCAAQAVGQSRLAKSFQRHRQLVKGARAPGLGRHAHPQVGTETHGTDLADGERQRIHQGLPPVAEWHRFVSGWSLRIGHTGQRPLAQTLQQAGRQRAQPASVQRVGEQQAEQLGHVGGQWGRGQQFAAHAVAEFAQKGRARSKAEIGQQGGQVHFFAEPLPPQTPTGAQRGVGIGGVEQGFQTPQGGGHV